MLGRKTWRSAAKTLPWSTFAEDSFSIWSQYQGI
jgi:hypothetical protein